MTDALGPIKQGEIKRLRFSFAAELDSGVTITSASVTATLYEGSDETPSAVLVGGVAVVDQSVFQLVQAGGSGSRIRLRTTAVASDGTRHIIDGDLLSE